MVGRDLDRRCIKNVSVHCLHRHLFKCYTFAESCDCVHRNMQLESESGISKTLSCIFSVSGQAARVLEPYISMSGCTVETS